MKAVLENERSLGYDPIDVSAENFGWDITSRMGNGEVRFLEVKGRAKGSRSVTLTKNEILASLNQPDRWFLVIVLIDENQNHDAKVKTSNSLTWLHQNFSDQLEFIFGHLIIRLLIFYEIWPRSIYN